ncbi:hypothetical protein ACFGVS_03105 [Mucilaginibacter sp. AW1-7]|uniref:hypothetical protein n=1 Tax=Mucilaginibacter sp. AW1-7 TaxID=3349874 RepID=UPI003F733AC2
MTPAEELLKTLTPKRLQEFGAIAVLAGSIEFWLERVIWSLTGEDVEAKKPSTDTLPVSILIDRLLTASIKIADNDLKAAINLWSQIAKPAFRCRNSILHGLGVMYGEVNAAFMTNTKWEGELRKRGSSSFHVNERTTTLLSAIFQMLLDAIIAIRLVLAKEKNANQFFTRDYVAIMQERRSEANEIVDLATAVNHEKY